MSGVKKTAIVLVAVLAAAQLVRPDRTNPPIDASRTIQAQAGTPSELGAVLERACRDCHSNGTVWRWYTHIAPVSWLMAAGVKKVCGLFRRLDSPRGAAPILAENRYAALSYRAESTHATPLLR